MRVLGQKPLPPQAVDQQGTQVAAPLVNDQPQAASTTMDMNIPCIEAPSAAQSLATSLTVPNPEPPSSEGLQLNLTKSLTALPRFFKAVRPFVDKINKELGEVVIVEQRLVSKGWADGAIN